VVTLVVFGALCPQAPQRAAPGSRNSPHAAVIDARAPPVFPLVMPFHWGDFAGRGQSATRMRSFLVSGELTLPLAGARVNRWISKSDTTARGLRLQVTCGCHFCGMPETDANCKFPNNLA
jgi:hypothetical protein